MPIRIDQKDFVSGLVFTVFGVAAIVMVNRYEMGSLVRMGPAYFPTLIGTLLAIVGLLLVVGSLRRHHVPVQWGSARPLMLVLFAVFGFEVLLEPAGLAAAAFTLVLLVYVAAGRFRPAELILLYLILLAGTYLLFVSFLRLPIPLLPGG